MIRVVLAVVVTAALVGLATPAIEAGATAASEQRVERQIGVIEAAAVDLYTREAIAPEGNERARRVRSLRFPSRGLASRPLTAFRIDGGADGPGSRVRYRIAGGTATTVRLDAPVVDPDGGPVDLGAVSGEQTVVLALDRTPSGRRVVRLSRGGP